MMRSALILLVLGFNLACVAQPYLDIAAARYQNSPGAGSPDGSKYNTFHYYNAGLNLPYIFKKDSSMIVFSPFAESWDISSNGLPALPGQLQSMGLPVTAIIPVTRRWSTAISAIPRWNGYADNLFDHSFQFGAAVIATYKKRNDLSYKLGLYYNSEFSGPYFMPLVGIDWKINGRSNLFGITPGSLTFEYRINKWFYCGALYRSITNTYRAGYLNFDPVYLRIQETQLAVFADFYLLKNIVFNVEAGHSVARKFRMGVEDVRPRYFFDEKMKDNFLLKASLSYRIRFR